MPSAFSLGLSCPSFNSHCYFWSLPSSLAFSVSFSITTKPRNNCVLIKCVTSRLGLKQVDSPLPLVHGGAANPRTRHAIARAASREGADSQGSFDRRVGANLAADREMDEMTLKGGLPIQDTDILSRVLGFDKGKASVLPPSGQGSDARV